MSNKINLRIVHLTMVMLLATLAAAPGQAQDLSLEIDGNMVAYPGELTSVQYSPLDQRLEVLTIFEDFRCAPVSSPGPAGKSMLVLDQINSDTEPDAIYTIAVPMNGGSIDLDSSARVLRVTTSSDPGDELECVRERNAFWASDFENPFKIEAATPGSPFPTGNLLSIPFTVRNQSLTTIATDVLVDFRWSARTPLGQPVTSFPAPTFSPSDAVTSLSGTERRWTIDRLWPGESRTINVEHDVELGLDPGTVILTEVFNIAASDREGENALAVGSQTTLESEVTTGEALLMLSKTQTAGPNPVTQAGQELGYDVVVENTGTFTLTGVAVTDTFPNGDQETLTGPVELLTADGVLEPGETWTYSPSYTVEQDDIDDGIALVNTASVVTNEVPGPTTATAETAVDGEASQAIDYTASVSDVDTAGQIVTYTLEIENSGDVSLTVSSVSANLPDSTDGTLSGPTESGTVNNKIDPGETWTYTTEYAVRQADLDNASTLVSSAVVTMDQAQAGTQNDVTTVNVIKNTSVGLTKRIVENEIYDAVGDVIEYAFDVENTGNQTLAGPVTIDDDLIGNVSCPNLSSVGDGDSNLQPEEIAICTGTIEVTQEHLDTGSIVNTATATVEGVTSDVSTATATANQMPEISLTKTVSAITVVNTSTVVTTEYENVGDVISYAFEVENSGNQTLAGPVTVNDNLTVDESCPALTSIGNDDSNFDPGETVVCTASYTVTQQDIDDGSVVNQATASAGGTTSNQDSATASAVQDHSMVVNASSSVDMGGDATIDAGDTINYSFTIQNLGNTTLTGLSVSPNNQDVTTSGSLASLAPGATDTTSFTASYVIKGADITAGSFSVVFNVSSSEGENDNESESTPLPQ